MSIQGHAGAIYIEQSPRTFLNNLCYLNIRHSRSSFCIDTWHQANRHNQCARHFQSRVFKRVHAARFPAVIVGHISL